MSKRLMPMKKVIPLLIYILFLLVPIYWLLNMSFKSNTEILGGLTLFPQPVDRHQQEQDVDQQGDHFLHRHKTLAHVGSLSGSRRNGSWRCRTARTPTG
jgi:ABC-type glycerol-3-phosphate transport system permease component